MRLVIDVAHARIRVGWGHGGPAWRYLDDAVITTDGGLTFTHEGAVADVVGPLECYRADGTVAVTSTLRDRIRNVHPGDTVTLSLDRDLKFLPDV